MKLIQWLVTMAVVMQVCHADTDVERQTLRGITVVDVLIEDLPSGAAAIGLTTQSIQTDVELKLRMAGLQVVKGSLGYLYVNVSFTPNGRGTVIAVGLNQLVKLLRDPSITTTASTWSVETVGMDLSAQDVRNIVKDKVDQFLNAWLSVNPRR